MHSKQLKSSPVLQLRRQKKLPIEADGFSVALFSRMFLSSPEVVTQGVVITKSRGCEEDTGYLKEQAKCNYELSIPVLKCALWTESSATDKYC